MPARRKPPTVHIHGADRALPPDQWPAGFFKAWGELRAQRKARKERESEQAEQQAKKAAGDG